MSNTIDFVHAWERYPTLVDLPESHHQFFTQAAEIAGKTDALVRPSIEEVGGANGYADSENLHIQTMATSPWALARNVLRRNPADGDVSLAYMHNTSGHGEEQTEVTRLALRIGQTGLYYSNLSGDGQIIRAGLTIFDGASTSNMTSNLSVTRKMDEEIQGARLSDDMQSLPGGVHTDISLSVFKKRSGGVILGVRSRLPRGSNRGEHSGIEPADVESMADAVGIMDTALHEVAARIDHEAKFRRRFPRLSAKLLTVKR